MRKEIADYEVRPGVVLSGRTTRVKIIPRGGHAKFNDRIHNLTWDDKSSPFPFRPELSAPDQEVRYTLYFLPMQESLDPQPMTAYQSVTVMPQEDGSLVFEHAFTGEQEYKLVIMDPADSKKQMLRLSIYCLLPDLYGKKAYRGDLHVHSYFSDGREAPEIVAANYRKRGFDFMALTDHHKMYPSKGLIESLEKVPTDLRVFSGEEVHVPYPTYIHAVNFGGNSSVNEFYVSNQEACDAEIADLAKSLPVPEGINALEVAQRVWVAQQIKKSGGMSILVHPHWMSNAYNMPDAITDYLFEHQVYDAFELLGGQSVHENNMQTAFYNEERAMGRKIPVVGSSDSHGTEPEIYFTLSSTLVFAQDSSYEGLTGAIKDLYSVAVEKVEMHPLGEYRVYGIYRYVKYARYLLENYFPRHDELCWEQGRLVKEYVCGDPNALPLLQALEGRAEQFANQFFGC